MGGPSLTLGIDPDLHSTGFAFVSTKGVLYAGTVTVSREMKGAEAAVEMARNLAAAFELVDYAPQVTVVEGQQLYDGPGKRHRRPQDIVHLANVAGAALGCVYARFPSTVGMLPKPRDWKGTINKGLKQRHILESLGVKAIHDEETALPIEVPSWGTHIRKSHWSHVIDALGLAQWGLTAYRARRALRRSAEARDG